MFLGLLDANHAEPWWNYQKKSALDPKRAKFDQKSGFWHLVSVSWGWGNRWPGSGGTLEGGRQSQPFKSLYKNPLEIPNGIPNQGINDKDIDNWEIVWSHGSSGPCTTFLVYHNTRQLEHMSCHAAHTHTGPWACGGNFQHASFSSHSSAMFAQA